MRSDLNTNLELYLDGHLSRLERFHRVIYSLHSQMQIFESIISLLLTYLFTGAGKFLLSC